MKNVLAKISTELEKQLEDYDAVILSDNQASQTDAESVSFIEIIMSTDSISNMFKELSDANELASTQRQSRCLSRKNNAE